MPVTSPTIAGYPALETTLSPVNPERKLRIAIPLEGFTVSGGIRVITQVASGLAARGHAVTLIVPDYQRETGFPLHPSVMIAVIPTTRRGVLRKIEYITKLIQTAAQDCDICMATSARTPIYFLLSLMLNRNRPKMTYLIQHYEVLSHAEQTAHPWIIRKFLAQFIKLGYRLPFHQAAVSGWIREQIKSPACAVIPNGVDLSAFSPEESFPRPSAKFVLGVIESDAVWKGYAPFLAALNALPESEKAEIFVRIASRAEVSLPDGIESARTVPNGDAEMANFYRGCDLFVFTSFIEGFGLPPLEAMACGVPVLTTDCGGIREFANATNACIVPPGDIKALTSAIIELKHNPEQREKLRDAGLQTAQFHSLAAMQNAHIAWLEAL